MKYKKQYNLAHVTSLDALRKEEFVVRQRISEREEELRMKMFEIPAELAAAGVNRMIPGFLKGKVTNAALNGGKKLINAFFVPEENQQPGLITHVVKNRSVFSIIKKGISIFKGRK